MSYDSVNKYGYTHHHLWTSDQPLLQLNSEENLTRCMGKLNPPKKIGN
uniref:Uncharacterized protein n=1 Tax=Arundo donax TaxID=35708 RepID=A0A0A9AVU0_ARUDO